MIDISKIVSEYGPKLLLAILILVLGSFAIKIMLRGIKKSMARSEVDANLSPFIFTLIRVMLRILVVLAVLGTMGVQMTSFIAILASAGLAIGLALSGTLQNFAGGVIILWFKPFKVGDTIKLQEFKGTVKAIQIFNTILLTIDNHEVIIPNGGISTSSLENFSTEEKRKIIWTFGIGYGDSVQKAREVLKEVLATDERILTEEAPFIKVEGLGDSSVNLSVRVWAKTSDYWDIYFETNEKVYDAFNKHGINIPFPQMDVHLRPPAPTDS